MTTRPRTRRDDRPDVILDAAEGALRRTGARGLTMDAVAAEAKLSKGGVLHHYASKDALICALVTRKIRRMREGIAAHEAKSLPGKPSAARAMVANARQTYCEEEGFPRALLVASAETPDALAEFRAFLDERRDAMGAIEGRPGAGSVLVFALIGLMVGRTLGFHDLAGIDADRVFDELDDVARKLVER